MGRTNFDIFIAQYLCSGYWRRGTYMIPSVQRAMSDSSSLDGLSGFPGDPNGPNPVLLITSRKGRKLGSA
jgi:hypothetical protein